MIKNYLVFYTTIFYNSDWGDLALYKETERHDRVIVDAVAAGVREEFARQSIFPPDDDQQTADLTKASAILYDRSDRIFKETIKEAIAQRVTQNKNAYPATIALLSRLALFMRLFDPSSSDIFPRSFISPDRDQNVTRWIHAFNNVLHEQSDEYFSDMTIREPVNTIADRYKGILEIIRLRLAAGQLRPNFVGVDFGTSGMHGPKMFYSKRYMFPRTHVMTSDSESYIPTKHDKVHTREFNNLLKGKLAVGRFIGIDTINLDNGHATTAYTKTPYDLMSERWRFVCSHHLGEIAKEGLTARYNYLENINLPNVSFHNQNILDIDPEKFKYEHGIDKVDVGIASHVLFLMSDEEKAKFQKIKEALIDKKGIFIQEEFMEIVDHYVHYDTIFKSWHETTGVEFMEDCSMGEYEFARWSDRRCRNMRVVDWGLVKRLQNSDSTPISIPIGYGQS